MNLFVSTSLYPRGAFEWCPDVRGTLPIGRAALGTQAEQVALRFSRAFLSGDYRTVRQLLDPSAQPLQKRHWTIAGKLDRVKVLGLGRERRNPCLLRLRPEGRSADRGRDSRRRDD